MVHATRLPPMRKMWVRTASQTRTAAAISARRIGVGSSIGELFAANTRNHIARARRVDQQRSELAQHDVTGDVSVLVVDALEVIEVDREQR
jgi:hypothetical protein